MSGLNAPIPLASLSEERRAHEPSMEDILASIRRIIADDDADFGVHRDAPSERRKEDDLRANARREPFAASPGPFHERAVAEAASPKATDRYPPPSALRRDADRPRFDAPLSPHTDAAPLAVAQDLAPSYEAAYKAAYPANQEEKAEQDFGADASEAHFGANEPNASFEVEGAAPLVSAGAAASIAAQFQTLAASMVINDSGLLHDYAREMLRPMLKAWLDDNLPVLVERLVRAEIERVARGGRR